MKHETQTEREQQELEIRAADPADREAVRRVTRRSLRTSYALSPRIIDAAIEAWYGGETFEAKLGRQGVLMLVAVADGDVAGFTESTVADDDGDVRWLHVAPAYRGERVGTRLFERTREELRAEGAERLRGTVLRMNAEGTAFYEQHGFERAATTEVEIGGTSYVEHVYVESAAAGLESVTANGREAYVDTDDADAGSNAPFHPVYADRNGESRLGYYCGNCDSVATAMGPMGRLQCQDCGNLGNPSRWDAAYL